MSEPMRDASKAEFSRDEMPRAVMVRSRSRNAVLHSLIPQMQTLLRQLGVKRNYGKNTDFVFDVVEIGDLTLASTWTIEGFYLRVSQGQKLLFTGYLSPRLDGKYLDGNLHVMTWQRGEWERRIFEPTPPAHTADDESRSTGSSGKNLVTLNSKAFV